MNTEPILAAMRADGVPAGKSGLWTVSKATIDQKAHDLNRAWLAFKGEPCPPVGSYTYLSRWTEATLGSSHGELVMNDFPSELRKHLQFVLWAHGRVLVTGLGLGCVVRGLLAVGRVESIDLVERDEHVIRLCGRSVEDPRVRLHVADARTMEVNGTWDYAWHDLWADPDKGEPHLQLIHTDVIKRLDGRVRRFGAWAMPRRFTRRIPGWIK